MVVNIGEQLKKIGFSEYESRAYITLLQAHPSTAYETAKTSGIPSSKIYQVIDRLAEKGVVLELNEQGKKRYIPMEPEEFIHHYRQDLQTTMEEIEKGFHSLKKERNVSYIWNLDSREAFVEKGIHLCGKAQNQILISAWKEELEDFLPALKTADSRDVQISIVHFGQPGTLPGQVFQHPIAETLYEEKGGRGFVMVIDSREALMGTLFGDNEIEGAWSRNKGFVTLAEDYIKHDIYIMKIVRRYDSLLIKTFGEGYRYLRDIFSDLEEVKG